MQKTRFNHQITAPEVRVINDEGEQLGIFKIGDALNLAQEHGLDLVEMSPNAKPPVVKLIGYDKFRYQQKKQEQQQKKRAKKVEVKTIRLSTRIGTHDLQTKAKHADAFLTDGDLVKIELRMRGREQAFVNLAEDQIKTFQNSLTVPYRVEMPAKRMGNTIGMTIAPGKVAAGKDAAKDAQNPTAQTAAK
ncbi:MAG TPA: translation initiation factor IF-3 [Candidatus Paceibacterota bacterium]|nr:translation initiation factor IF-3 [Candidatus Paceibacterota bacterium]